MSLENMKWSARASPSPATITCTITWKVCNRHISGDREQAGGCLELGVLEKNMEGSTVSFWGDTSVLKLPVLVAQLGEYAKNFFSGHLKWVNYMVCELYLNKALKKKDLRCFHKDTHRPEPDGAGIWGFLPHLLNNNLRCGHDHSMLLFCSVVSICLHFFV